MPDFPGRPGRVEELGEHEQPGAGWIESEFADNLGRNPLPEDDVLLEAIQTDEQTHVGDEAVERIWVDDFIG